MLSMKTLTTLIFVIISFSCWAWQLRGLVTDERGEPIPYASVYLENSTYGVATNIKGEYLMNFENGTYKLVFQAVGFETLSKTIVVKDANLKLNVALAMNARMLEIVTIEADREDPAYPIIRSAIAARKQNNKAVKQFECDVYSKISLEKEFFIHDTLEKAARDTIENKLTKQRMNFIETQSKLYFKQPNFWKEIKLAVNDLDADKRGNQAEVIIEGYGDEIFYGAEPVNRLMFKSSLGEAVFNFYNNLIDLPNLGQVPFSSPIGSAAFVNYKYRLESTFYEDGFWVNKIEVTPKRKFSALFSGYIYVVDSLWSIKAVDLEPEKTELTFFDYMRIFQEFEWTNDSIWLVKREEYFYETKDGTATQIGNTNIVYEHYNLAPDISDKFFNNEVLRIEDNAYDLGFAYWDSIRPIELKAEELDFILEQDSIMQYQKSAEYLMRQDSSVNEIKFWDFILNGIVRQNSFKKQTFFINPLLNQLRPLGVGGYRHALGGWYKKEFNKATSIRITGELNYGFLNKDLKGEAGFDMTYLPKRFGRFHAEYRNNYEMLNTFASFETIFSRSNYVRDIFYSFGHDIEIFNGVYLDLTLEYGEKLPITGMKLSQWSQEVFGATFNTPVSFQPYREFGIDVRVKLTPFQKYQMKPYKKVVLPSKWPSATIWYKKGIPGVFGSITNLDFIEIKVDHKIQLGTWGYSKWRIMTGAYVNEGNVMVADYKYFRRSDAFWFSNPLQSFQLLRPAGAAITTTNPYFQANYLHNFEGTLLNKIPLVRNLGLQAMGGVGTLMLADDNFKHAEAFAGIERPFKIKKQLFKFGTYYTIGQSTIGNFKGEFKFAIDFFNDFTNSWSY